MQELYLERILQSGDRGRDVVELQRTLVGWGMRESPVMLDGVFGPVTSGAVSRFQDAHGLEATGATDGAFVRTVNSEIVLHPFSMDDYRCPCGGCGGFGSGRYKHEYRTGKPHIEAFHRYEYPGVDITLVWAVRALMHRAGLREIQITSGYRCWRHNEQTGRTSTNHMGKAVDFIGIDGGEHNGSAAGKRECSECARVRSVGIDACGFQAGWAQPNCVSLEMAYHGAYTWVHIDTRCIPEQLRKHTMVL